MHSKLQAPTGTLSFPYWVIAALLAVLLPAAYLFQAGTGILSDPPGLPVSQSVSSLHNSYGELPLYFVANHGQVDDPVAYYVQGLDKTLYFTPQGVTFSLVSAETPWVVKLDFEDSSVVQPVGRQKAEAVFSYFKGTVDKWRTGIPSYSEVAYAGLWPGIDLIYSGTVERLKYRFIVNPGADPGRIRLAYRGADVQLDHDGQLEVSTPAGAFVDEAPLAYQVIGGQRIPVSVSYALDGASYGFRLGVYNPHLPLVIDPALLVYSGYIGGSATDGDSDGQTDIAVDSLGSAYIVGTTRSTEATFPDVAGPDLTYNGGDDVFIAKVSPDGTQLEYCGYIGGALDDEGHGIAVDAEGYAYIMGTTGSPQTQSFPVVVGPDLTFNGFFDVFVTKLSPNGQTLIFSGFIGGTERDYGYDIGIDNAGNAYVTSYTYGANFPLLTGPAPRL